MRMFCPYDFSRADTSFSCFFHVIMIKYIE